MTAPTVMADQDLRAADLRIALSAGAQTFAVHYACESFYEALDHPPGVSAISISGISSSGDRTFSRVDVPSADEGERHVLSSFFSWMASHPDARLVHWNMNRSDFGFTALANRYVHVTGDAAPPMHSEDRLYNLHELIAYRHGPDYARDPRLLNLVKLNGITTRYTLTGAEQAERYRDGRHADLARCATERAQHIARVGQLYVAGNLQTERSGPAVRFAGAMLDSVTAVLALGDRLWISARELADRRTGKPALVLQDEYDYQDVLRALLRVFFDDVRPEDAASEVAGGASRIDFVLPEYGLAVELKASRDSLDARKLGEELLVDIGRYTGHKDVRHLVCLVFDRDRLIANPRGLERDLSRSTNGLAVTVRIYA